MIFCTLVEKKIEVIGIIHSQIYAQLKTELLKGERYWFDNKEEEEKYLIAVFGCRKAVKHT